MAGFPAALRATQSGTSLALVEKEARGKSFNCVEVDFKFCAGLILSKAEVISWEECRGRKG